MDYNKHTKLRIYLKINCTRNRDVNTALLILLINVRLCQKKGCNRGSNRICQYETVTVISILNMTINIVFTGNVQVEAGRIDLT